MTSQSPSPSKSARPQRSRALAEAVAASVAVTAAVALIARLLPDRFVATGVGAVFLGATWLLVWRADDARVERAGLTLAGLVMPGPLDARALGRAALRATAWALGFAGATFVPFFLGWRVWWHAEAGFSPEAATSAFGDAFGHLVIIALPEEAFYRGYLHSRLDEVWPPQLRVAGARIGIGLVVASAIFALGHLATVPHPARLAVFFPSLLFGWLRARTNGIGASCGFHALCNVFSQLLGRGYGVY